MVKQYWPNILLFGKNVVLTNQQRSVRVVYRLRIAFGLIVLLMIVGVLGGGIQLYLLQRSQVSAIQESVPALIHSQVLESQLASLLGITNRLRNANSSTEVLAQYSEIQKLEVAIEKTVAKDLRQTIQTSKQNMLWQGVQSLVQVSAELVPIRQQLVSIEKALVADRHVLVNLRTVFGDLIEPRSITLATALTFGLDSSLNEKILRDAISSQIDLTELSFRLSTAIDVAEQLSRQLTASEADIDATHLQFNLRSVAQILITLEDNEFRFELAKLIKQLRGVIVGPGGIVDKLESYADYQNQTLDVERRQTAASQSVSQLIDSIVLDAKVNISQSSKYFNTYLNQSVVFLVLSGLIAIFVIVLTNYYVIERQFNRRISNLTSAVLDIAAGDVRRNVGVEGADEIGLMAKALAVFKDTSNKLILSNRELEQFAYAASHDLRSPLRAIENLAQWTLEDAGDALPESCHDNLVKLIERANRLSILQTDLLEYSRAGHTKDSLELIHINDVMDDLSGMLDPEHEYPIENIGESYPINTYATPLRQVLLNLMNNAMKHHDLEQGNIQLKVEYCESRMIISFSDDGVGIEPKYHDQIFGLFKRLQSQDIVEGSGLGLSLVRKLVERHGGKIEVFSNPADSRGTTFIFDWPVTYEQHSIQLAAGF
ncbi:MAG: ATP-binding protein [Granulosicoccus sp.]